MEVLPASPPSSEFMAAKIDIYLDERNNSCKLNYNARSFQRKSAYDSTVESTEWCWWTRSGQQLPTK